MLTVNDSGQLVSPNGQTPQAPPVNPALSSQLKELSESEGGLLDRRMFFDPEIYKVELERVFARSWSFLCHESQLAKAGDFFSTYIGADPVVVTRQRDGSISAVLNSCRHRGMKVCRADWGNAKAFTCTYHGWSYSTDGSLVSVPREEYAYYNEIDKSKLGLLRVPQVQSYKGLVFGCFDPEAPSLVDFLGDMTYYLDILLDRVDGGTEVISGVHKWKMRGNWKLAAEQFSGDNYHTISSHISVLLSEFPPEAADAFVNIDGLEINPAEGHGIGVMYSPTGAPFSAGSSEAILRWRDETRQESINRLGKERVEGMSWTHANVFPNFSYLHDSSVLRVWMPKSPTEMEAWSWCIVDKKAPQEVKNAWRTQAIRHFSPGGTWEQDDGENWSYCSGAGGQEGVVTRLSKLHVEMGVGHERSHPTLPGKVSHTYSEQNQRSLYRRWAEFMAAESWKDISVPVRTTEVIDRSDMAKAGES
uniref:Alpha subunit of dibenzofuran dioxygenase n=4 Tax=Intrasporangiaceae TaxID=85021 RepID=Q8L0Y4_9MICO|nr:alpha subunit of dibenzofuran dioxygenase [Terrabacter sp. YK3]